MLPQQPHCWSKAQSQAQLVLPDGFRWRKGSSSCSFPKSSSSPPACICVALCSLLSPAPRAFLSKCVPVFLRTLCKPGSLCNLCSPYLHGFASKYKKCPLKMLNDTPDLRQCLLHFPSEPLRINLRNTSHSALCNFICATFPWLTYENVLSKSSHCPNLQHELFLLCLKACHPAT